MSSWEIDNGNHIMPVMRGYYVGPIREEDASGRLTAAGVRWSEPAVFVTVSSILAAVAFAALSLLSMVFSLNPADSWKTGFALLIVGFSLLVIGWRIDHKRAIVFHDDGRMTIPFGLTGWGMKREVFKGHLSIASIEAEAVQPAAMADGRHGARVVIYWSDGTIYTVTGDRLSMGTAHKIVVQLTRALKEQRDSIAHGSVAQVLID